MFIPEHFRQDDLATLHSFIEQNSFALLCSMGEGGVPFATHLPFLLDRNAGKQGTLIAHVARANPHWRLGDGKPALVVFSGPHHYISPTWYGEPGLVPTWNYAVVHVTGMLHAVHDPDVIRRIVSDMVGAYESAMPQPYQMGDGAMVEKLLAGVVSLKIEIEIIEGKWKVGQNRTPAQRQGAIKALRSLGSAEADAVAALMEQVTSPPLPSAPPATSSPPPRSSS